MVLIRETVNGIFAIVSEFNSLSDMEVIGEAPNFNTPKLSRKECNDWDVRLYPTYSMDMIKVKSTIASKVF